MNDIAYTEYIVRRTMYLVQCTSLRRRPTWYFVQYTSSHIYDVHIIYIKPSTFYDVGESGVSW